MKRCSKCGIEKDESEFYKNATCKDGRRIYCIKCQIVLTKEYYQKNKEKEKKRSKEKYQNNLQYSKEYRQKNKEKMNNVNMVNSRKYRFNLADNYVVARICRQFKIPYSEITHELIELKRIELSNKRLIKKLKENETK